MHTAAAPWLSGHVVRSRRRGAQHHGLADAGQLGRGRPTAMPGCPPASRTPTRSLTGSLLRASPYQPRSRHSARCGRSAPSVVSVPWPGYTQVASGSRPKSFSETPSYSVLNRFGSFCVLPTPPGNPDDHRPQASRTPPQRGHLRQSDGSPRPACQAQKAQCR
jgi:hypothetical protein